MKRLAWILGALGLAALIVAAARRPRAADAAGPAGVPVAREDVRIWSAFEGMLDSRQVIDFACRINSGVITEMMPEGQPVRAGDVLVRFDATAVERDLVRIQRELDLAKADLEGLEFAKIPMEVRDLELQLAQNASDLLSEEQFLVDSRELLKDGLVAEMDVRKQEQKVVSLGMKQTNLAHQIQVTRDFLHPSLLARARAALAAADREWMAATQMLERCTIPAPCDGVVVYRPQYMQNEFRVVRVGDTLSRNQVFMSLPNMTNLVVHLDVPESDVARVAAGQRVEVIPKAFPDLRLRGTVESVGSMAQMQGDRRSWQKTFHVVIGMQETSPRLRTGMSVLCKILVVEAPQALVILRAAVRWDGDRPYCLLQDGRRCDLRLGDADETRYIVESGVSPGDRARTR